MIRANIAHIMKMKIIDSLSLIIMIIEFRDTEMGIYIGNSFERQTPQVSVDLTMNKLISYH